MIVFLSAVQDRWRVHEWSLFFTISVLIVNLKQQEIHRDPQPFTVHVDTHAHTNSNRTHTAPSTTFHTIIAMIILNWAEITACYLKQHSIKQKIIKTPAKQCLQSSFVHL